LHGVNQKDFDIGTTINKRVLNGLFQVITGYPIFMVLPIITKFPGAYHSIFRGFQHNGVTDLICPA
jgi:hypothetical protein